MIDKADPFRADSGIGANAVAAGNEAEWV